MNQEKKSNKFNNTLNRIFSVIKKISLKLVKLFKKLAINIFKAIKVLFTKTLVVIKKILKKKHGIAILGGISALLIAIITLIICLIVISANDNKTHILKKEKWHNFIIYIEGEEIKLGDKISSLKSYGYNAVDDNYNMTLDQKYISGGLIFEYKDKKANNGENTIFFSAYNPSIETKKISDCEIYGIELSQQFYQKYKVVLPGGLILNEELTIEDIIKVWGHANTENNNYYHWATDNNQGVKIYTKDDGSIISLVYGA